MGEALDHGAPDLGRLPFDEAALARYVTARVDGFRGAMTVSRFEGGQSNPTYLLTADGERYVLRKKPAGVLLPSAHAVEREFKVISALRGSAAPVARALCLCEDPSIIGTPFYVMAHVEGRLFWDPTLPDLSRADRAALYDDVCRVIAALHAVDPAAVGLADFGRPGHYMARQVARWSRQYSASQTQSIPAMDRLIEWLPRHLPRDGATAIVHGDLRLDNMIFHPSEPRVLALLDWELSTLGDPLADFAYHMLTWYLRADAFPGMANADLAALGIPEAPAYLEKYFERVGRDPAPRPVWDYYLVYNLFRLSAILQGIAKRVDEGTAAADNARETGAKARTIAEIAWRWARERLGAG